ncbi:sulfhydryl oxidase 1 isoform X1 [Cryptomeria japonica]|uniref:sulfhydryl oxidase 1 isoform X1 n=1 Tax=Cryptomeria japonica TaxID=3369 RepID=UPI0027DA6A3B|nr:sulfhydryl oxidase 1 isoform X1 [Cryptomeria japonica]XP_057835847.2 sulfhydryl oxidase 1 isoform X1 [Cryptomeria japonica]
MDPMLYERRTRFPGVFILFMVLVSLGTVGAQGQEWAGRALMARKIDEPAQGDVDAAVELKKDDFNRTLSVAPSSWTIVEFFAHWCPACRNYKPHYEKVARLFNGPNSAHPGIVFMTKVDCALKVNTKLCDRFSVSHYPLLLWGPPSKFAFGSWEPNADSGIEPIENARTAESLLKWINKKISKSYNLDDEKFENELPANASDPVEVARSIYDIEEATANIFEIFVDNKAINSDARVSFIRFLQLVAVHHPSKRCRRGSMEILVNFDELWPSHPWSSDSKQGVQLREKDAFRNLHVCGKEIPRGYWIFCRGSKNETRGLSCGLWLLFHSLSVRIEDGESMTTFTAICDFVHNFFICEECRQHFFEMCSRVREPMKSRYEFSLWLWRAHNEVNERLMVEEASLQTGDPKFPKMIWPPKQLCASCWISSKKYNSTHVDVNWNNTAVYQFLLDFYGRNIKFPLRDNDQTENIKLESALVEDITPSNAVTVPIGAAVAIAIASCGFGAVACFWRMQQKKRSVNVNLGWEKRFTRNK